MTYVKTPTYAVKKNGAHEYYYILADGGSAIGKCWSSEMANRICYLLNNVPLRAPHPIECERTGIDAAANETTGR